jgi:hypothetical protein
VVAPGEPKEVVTTGKKSRSRNALETNWCEDRTALVSTYGYRLHGAKARAAPSKSSFDKAKAKAKAAAEARWANHRALVERVESLVKVSPSESTSALCLRIICTEENAADKSRFPVTDGLSGARRFGIHYLYDGPLGRPEESGWDGKGGTLSIISALLFIPSGSAAAVRKVLTDCQGACLATERYDADGGVKERGRQPVIEEYSPQAYLVYQAKKWGCRLARRR